MSTNAAKKTHRESWRRDQRQLPKNVFRRTGCARHAAPSLQIYRALGEARYTRRDSA
jgi:hypothetical protein